MATMVAVSGGVPMAAVVGLEARDGLRRGGAMRVRVGARKGVRCVADSAHVALQNQAEQLLEDWARQPAVASGRSSETEGVTRLFLWDSLPKKGTP
jgi:hypothetical protein